MNNDIKNKLNRFNFEKEAVLLVEDEMMLTTQTTCQKLWLPRGTYSLIEVASKRERRCIYGFLNVLQGTEHAFKTEGANSESTIQCLENMGNLYSKKQIVIVWDNASWHRSKLLKTFLTKTAHDFYLINFPAYAPEENPQEHVWKAGRVQVSHNKFIPNIDIITDKLVAYLNQTNFRYKFLTWNVNKK